MALEGVDDLLAESFAGTWFSSPDRGRLKIGVVDGRPGRENAARVRAGLAERGVEGQSDFVSVGSTLTELEAAQADLSGSLSALVAAGKASIGIDPSENAVAIRAIEGLTRAEEAALTAAAAASRVRVTVDRRSVASLAIKPEGGARIAGGGSGCRAGFSQGSRERKRHRLDRIGTLRPPMLPAAATPRRRARQCRRPSFAVRP